MKCLNMEISLNSEKKTAYIDNISLKKFSNVAHVFDGYLKLGI